VSRRLAAILMADIVGYSRLMELDEAGTFATLKSRRREILAPSVAQHHGRLVKVMGDGVLVEFASAVEAVGCALDLQKLFAEANRDLPEDRAIVLRIGVNLGDVIVEGSDLYGDGVNVAARLQALAEPGSICVSRSIYDQVRRKIDIGFDDLGTQTIKNIADPVHVYRIHRESESVWKQLPLPDKPSIAILPFTSMSSDADQEQFADGLTEDLITDLSRNADLFVIARNSTFAYKGKSVDARTIARDLGVRYLLEGSARRAAGKVRINVQLIDAIGGGHIWAERFDRSLEDVFAVQDEVTVKIVEALIGRLVSQLPRNRPRNMEAYDLCVRCRSLGWGTPQANRESYILLSQAVALDPNYAEAHRSLAGNRWQAWMHLGEPEHPNRSLAVTLAEKSVALDPSDAACRRSLGNMLIYERRWAEADAAIAAALELNPNFADAWALLSDYSVLRGNAALAVEQGQRALRLNPHPPGWYYWNLGFAQYAARRFDDAVTTLRNASTYRTSSRRILAASLAQLGRMEEARQEGSWFMASHPDFTIRHWAAAQPFRDEDTRRHFVDGYRKAGLPE
jgi:TolB-like protein/class 3 adenylate cyclase